jgi:hypothetical protein
VTDTDNEKVLLIYETNTAHAEALLPHTDMHISIGVL